MSTTAPTLLDDTPVQLATRIPRSVHRKLKLHCVHHQITVMDFVTGAIRRALVRATKPPALATRVEYDEDEV